MLGRGLGHALQALELLARLLLDLFGHAGLGDRLLELLDLGGGALGLAELLLDRLQLLAQDVLALAALDGVPGLLPDVPRDLQHLDAVAQQLQHLVEAGSQLEQLQDLLLLLRLQIHEARHQVGALRGGTRRLHGIDELRRHLREELERLERALLEMEQAGLDLRRPVVGFFEAVDACGDERVARHELAHPKALLALDHDVVVAVRRGHVTQDAPDAAHFVQLVGRRIVGLGHALQQHADRALAARRLLGRRDRFRPAQRERHHDAGEQHDVAHRHDAQHVVRQRRLAGADDASGF